MGLIDHYQSGLLLTGLVASHGDFASQKHYTHGIDWSYGILAQIIDSSYEILTQISTTRIDSLCDILTQKKDHFENFID